jgi:hypothetical protein
VDQVELDRRDDAEHPLAAPQGEEEVRVLGRGDPPQHAVTGDDLDGADLVDGEPVGPGHGPEPAAGGIADDADVGDRSRERGQAVRRGGLHDAEPLDAGSGASPALGVDDHLVELLGADQQLGGQLGHRPVPGRLRSHPDAVAGRELHGLDHVLCVVRREDGCRADRDGEVPRRDERVVLPVAGNRDGADGEGVQLLERCAVGGAGLCDGHASSRDRVVVDSTTVEPRACG